MDLEEVAARLEIMDLSARYTRAGDTGRAAELAELFAPDGELVVDGGTGRGPTGIADLIETVKQDFAAAPPQFFPARHNVSGLTIDFHDDGRAAGRSYFTLIAGWGVDHWGVYRDEYVRHDGRWRFARRSALLDGTVEQSPVRHRLTLTRSGD